MLKQILFFIWEIPVKWGSNSLHVDNSWLWNYSHFFWLVQKHHMNCRTKMFVKSLNFIKIQPVLFCLVDSAIRPTDSPPRRVGSIRDIPTEIVCWKGYFSFRVSVYFSAQRSDEQWKMKISECKRHSSVLDISSAVQKRIEKCNNSLSLPALCPRLSVSIGCGIDSHN